VDIVVTCTGSPRPIIGRAQVTGAMRARRGQPLFLIDIAVPRDIDPEVNAVDNVYLYDIDGLEDVVDANLEERRQAAARARHEIAGDAEAFDRWRQSLEVAPTIIALRETLLEMGRREVERFRRRMGPLTPAQEQALQHMTQALIQKILHRPVVHLRRSVERGDMDASTALYREVFGIGEPKAPGSPEKAEDAEQQPRGPRRVLRGGKES
jgi:glutamyl-tRNA reductase